MTQLYAHYKKTHFKYGIGRMLKMGTDISKASLPTPKVTLEMVKGMVVHSYHGILLSRNYWYNQ